MKVIVLSNVLGVSQKPLQYTGMVYMVFVEEAWQSAGCATVSSWSPTVDTSIQHSSVSTLDSTAASRLPSERELDNCSPF